MKKIILIITICLPLFCFSQVTEKSAKEIKETATEIMDALDGINPSEDYIKINNYVSKTFSNAIVKITLEEYKKNGHFYLCFFPNIKSVGAFYLYNNKINLRPILLDPNCQNCIVKTSFVYKDIESKAMVNLFYEKLRNALTPYLAALIYNSEFITYIKNNN